MRSRIYDGKYDDSTIIFGHFVIELLSIPAVGRLSTSKDSMIKVYLGYGNIKIIE